MNCTQTKNFRNAVTPQPCSRAEHCQLRSDTSGGISRQGGSEVGRLIAEEECEVWSGSEMDAVVSGRQPSPTSPSLRGQGQWAGV